MKRAYPYAEKYPVYLFSENMKYWCILTKSAQGEWIWRYINRPKPLDANQTYLVLHDSMISDEARIEFQLLWMSKLSALMILK